MARKLFGITVDRVYIHKGSNTVRFEYRETSQKALTNIRAIQGHSAERMGKEFIYHKGCRSNLNSILEHGLVAGGKQSSEGRHTVFLTPLKPCGQDDEEESIHGDMTVPMKFHYCSKWRHDQGAVCEKLKVAQN